MHSRVLIVGPAWIGDMVMAQSLFKQLQQQQHAAIDVIAPTPTLAVLKRMPEVDRAFELRIAHGRLALRTRWCLARRLRGSYQQAIVLPSSFKSALIPWLAGIARRTGYLGEQRYGLLNDIHQLDKLALPLCVQRFVGLALPGGQLAIDKIEKPCLRIDIDNQLLALNKFKLQSTRPVLALCPGAEYGPAKRWPISYFKIVAQDRIKRGWQVWVFGAAKDQALGDAICADLGEFAINLAAQTSLGQAIDLLALATCVISNDSGLMHIAAAVGSNLIALYGSSSPDFTPPLSTNCQLLALQLDCRPCFKRVCPYDHFDCMNQLLPVRVLTALDNMTAKHLSHV